MVQTHDQADFSRVRSSIGEFFFRFAFPQADSTGFRYITILVYVLLPIMVKKSLDPIVH